MTPDTAPLSVVADIRARAMQGLASIPCFAEAIGKSVRTTYFYISQGMPIEYIGRTPMVVVEPAIRWLRGRPSGRRKNPAPRPVGRPRKSA